jgi:CRISPR-associated endonuclease/helicase Cas3
VPARPELLRLWAKLGNETWPDIYHPLICHLIDVAHVTRGLWDHVFRPRVKAWVARRLKVSEGDAGKWLAFWAGAHDIGKACPGFQVLGDNRTARLKAKFPSPPWNYPFQTFPHGELSAAILAKALESGGAFAPLGRAAAHRVAVAVGGHHGLFCPDWSSKVVALGNEPWAAAQRELLAELAQHVGVVGLKAPAPAGGAEDNPVWMYLAGLTSVADWIGSNQQFFPPFGTATLADTGFSVDEYSQQSAGQAMAALTALGWLGRADDPTPQTFREVFPEIQAPRPLQEAIEQIAGAWTHQSEPMLVIVEAPMGEGKTEAAWYVADRWDRLGGQGCYVALPTMATSNQMFDRVAGFLGRRSGKSAVQLLHGKAQLNEKFEDLKYRAYVYDEDKKPAAVVAEGWFAANKKHGLLAPFGVGTIDQSLLAVLQTKHVFVRLFGLAGKCVILDEVHAYDAYMTTLLERLLQWLAALGCPVVLLSATLPSDRRLRLLRAYSGNETAVPNTADYPRITTAGGGQESTAVHVEADKDRAGTVALEWVSEDGFTGRLAEALKGGGCACVIRNTVGLAQETYLRLKNALPPDVTVELFHARFPFGQRQRIENDVLRRYGRTKDDVVSDGSIVSAPRRPARAVLVATQVVEQSLDLDFDLMVSDVAPADLVLQRAGRLHRHRRKVRPATMASPQVYLIEPAVGEDGVPDFGVSEFVYARYVLLRSYLALRGRERVELPADLERLVEQVYGDEPLASPDEYADPLEESHEELVAETKRQRVAGRSVLVAKPLAENLFTQQNAALEDDDPGAHPRIQAATRDTEPSVQVIVVFGGPDGDFLDPERTVPFREPDELTVARARRLMLNEISATHKGVVFALIDSPVPGGWRKKGLLRHHRLLRLDGQRGAVIGKYRVVVDPDLGLLVAKFDGNAPNPDDGV